MIRRSLWTPEAEAAFRSVHAYLEHEWGPLAADAFAEDVAHTVALLELFPHGGILELSPQGIRSIPVARQVRLFYRITDEAVIILELLDTRSERFQGLRG